MQTVAAVAQRVKIPLILLPLAWPGLARSTPRLEILINVLAYRP